MEIIFVAKIVVKNYIKNMTAQEVVGLLGKLTEIHTNDQRVGSVACYSPVSIQEPAYHSFSGTMLMN